MGNLQAGLGSQKEKGREREKGEGKKEDLYMFGR